MAVPTPQVAHRNEVAIRGRLAAPPSSVDLPSGDAVTTFRLVVVRPVTRRPSGPGRPITVDTLDRVIWRVALRRTAARWRAGDTVEVTGALRRRFWRPTTGPASRYEIEVASARVVTSG